MHPIYFYRDKNGHEPVIEYLEELASKSDKDSMIKLKKNTGLYKHPQTVRESGRRTIYQTS